MTFADVKPGRRIRAGHILELQDMVGGFQDQLDAIPEAEDLVDMQADIDGLKDGTVPVPLAGIEDALGAAPELQGMPLVISRNYQRSLSRFNSLSEAIADLPNAGADGGTINVDGDWAITGTNSIPSGIQIVGRGETVTRITVPENSAFAALDVDGGDHVAFHGFTLEPESGVTAAGGFGIRVRGEVDRVDLDHITVRGFGMPIQTDGSLGTVPGTIHSLNAQAVRALEATTYWGWGFGDIEYVNLLGCESCDNWLDGFKFRKKVSNVVVTGGKGSRNGRSLNPSYGNNPALNGDGIDFYAGADSVTITGFAAESNWGSGFQIKSIPSTGVSTAEFGYVRKLRLIGVAARYNYAVAGITMSADTGYPIVDDMEIIGGDYSDNTSTTNGYGLGLLIAARNVRIIGASVNRNHSEGLYVHEDSFDVLIEGLNARANSQRLAGAYPAVSLAGDNIRFMSGAIVGVDSPDILLPSDEAALTVYHSSAVAVRPDASNVVIGSGVMARYYIASVPFLVNSGASAVVIEGQQITANPSAYGSSGSTALRTNSTDPYTQRWTRLGDNDPSVSTGNWYRYMQLPPLTALPTAGASYTGQVMYLKVNASTAGVFKVCRETATAGVYEWKEITLA